MGPSGREVVTSCPFLRLFRLSYQLFLPNKSLRRWRRVSTRVRFNFHIHGTHLPPASLSLDRSGADSCPLVMVVSAEKDTHQKSSGRRAQVSHRPLAGQVGPAARHLIRYRQPWDVEPPRHLFRETSLGDKGMNEHRTNTKAEWPYV